MLGVEQFLGSWTITSPIILTTILLLYWFSTNNHAYWKKQGVPYHKPLPLFGSMRDIIKKPMHDIDLERYMEYGPIYGYFAGNQPFLSVGDPALLKDILVKDFPAFPARRSIRSRNELVSSMVNVVKGDDWKRIRSIITPAFSTGKMKRMMGKFSDCAKTIVQNFRSLTNEGKPIDVKRMYGALSMDVIASSVFSTKIDSHNDPDNEFVTMAKRFFTNNIFTSFRFFLLRVAPKLANVLGITVFSLEVVSFFKQVTLQIMEERKRTGQTRNDFLQLLMDTAKEVSDAQKKDLQEKGASNYEDIDINSHILKNVTSKNLSLDELVAQCVIFFIAGYDTTASTLSFSSYLLAVNPDIQDIVRQEVDQAVLEANGELTYEAIQRMKYLDNVISETLRLYPPATRLERVAEYDYKLGDTGITIPKNMIVTIPTYAIHRDAKLFPNPEIFDPNRFTPEERAKRDQYTYLPFGAGPRNCVAMRFALMEVKVCLAHVIANFHIRKCPETQEPLEFDFGQVLLQPKGIFLRMEARSDRRNKNKGE
ncbi:hypothetical protein JTE90_017765 [Oedothorax gibbosus]|uniref:Cytochrome P450 n=1 Tax=Oedothorax gibbosus TaxID=931172 RepID=A0AAV6UMY3_9ARAC|nr:hypothetical protein JTE90_017765 [Oedothorax gibbosus]